MTDKPFSITFGITANIVGSSGQKYELSPGDVLLAIPAKLFSWPCVVTLGDGTTIEFVEPEWSN